MKKGFTLITPDLRTGGFTLIELSIIIVIIGILIAGVIMGGDVINSGKLNAQIVQLNNIGSGYRTFKEKYDGIPGDLSDAESYFGAGNTDNGNGDKIINSTETLLFFQHLDLADMYQYKASPVNSAYAIGKYGNSCLYATADATWVGAVPSNFKYNFLYLGDATLSTQRCKAGLTTPFDASSIDKKIDNGNPSTGIIIGETGYNPNTGALFSPTCISSGAYRLSSVSRTSCIIRYVLK